MPVLVVSLVMAEPKPLIAAAFLCEKVLEEEGSVYSAIRIVDTFTVKAVEMKVNQLSEQLQPASSSLSEQQAAIQAMNVAMSALVMIKAGDVTGQHEMRLRMRNPANKVTEFAQKMPVNFDTGDPATGVTVNLNFVMPGNHAEGLYWLEVVWDGDLLTKIPLRLRKELPGETKS